RALMCPLVLHCHAPHRDLRSLPTRRSSDLGGLSPGAGASMTSTLARWAAALALLASPSGAAAQQPDLRALEARTRAIIAEYRGEDRKSTRLNSSHDQSSYAVFCLKKKTTTT